MINKIRQHFLQYQQMKSWEFCWKITFEGLIVSIPILLLFLAIFGVPEELEAAGPLMLEDLFGAVVFAPITETLVLQAFPIFIVRALKGSMKWQILASTIFFAAPHFLLDVATGIGAGLIGGFYSAFTYSHWRNKSKWDSFWVTTVSHGIHNGLLIFASVALESLTLANM